jgi:hypothetical protein
MTYRQRMEVEGNLFWIDRKRRIVIVSFIDCGSWVWPAESSEMVGSPNEYTFYIHNLIRSPSLIHY